MTLSAGFIPSGRPNVTLAHELGHACNLFHLTDPTNLMDTTSPGPSGSMLRFWQELLIRASRHVSYV